MRRGGGARGDRKRSVRKKEMGLREANGGGTGINQSKRGGDKING